MNEARGGIRIDQKKGVGLIAHRDVRRNRREGTLDRGRVEAPAEGTSRIWSRVCHQGGQAAGGQVNRHWTRPYTTLGYRLVPPDWTQIQVDPDPDPDPDVM